MSVVTRERYDLERVTGAGGGLRVGNATGSFLTSEGDMNEEESSSSIQVFVGIVELGRCRPEREETIVDRRERAGTAVK
jgi:hypothetical protein